METQQTNEIELGFISDVRYITYTYENNDIDGMIMIYVKIENEIVFIELNDLNLNTIEQHKIIELIKTDLITNSFVDKNYKMVVS